MNRLLQAATAVAFAAGIRRRDPSVIVNGALSLSFAALPRVLERRYGVRVRPWQRAWVSASGLVHTVGMLGPYDRVWWWDHLAHTLSSAVVAGAADAIHRAAPGSGPGPTPSRSTFVVGITFGLGVVWEAFEYVVHALGDRVGFEPLLVHYGRLDAIGDLAFDVLGAGLVVLFDPSNGDAGNDTAHSR